MESNDEFSESGLVSPEIKPIIVDKNSEIPQPIELFTNNGNISKADWKTGYIIEPTTGKYRCKGCQKIFAHSSAFFAH